MEPINQVECAAFRSKMLEKTDAARKEMDRLWRENEARKTEIASIYLRIWAAILAVCGALFMVTMSLLKKQLGL